MVTVAEYKPVANKIQKLNTGLSQTKCRSWKDECLGTECSLSQT